MRILAKVSYNGANYQGWQKQPDAPSVQETIEKQISRILNRPISIYGAGRTDSGVHALGQTFHFDLLEDGVDLNRLLYSLNSLLPPDIRIDKLEVVNNDFHARYSAKGKIYSYAIDLEAKNPLEYQILYPCPYDIDVDKFVDVLTHFVGIHNFKNFSSKENDEDNFVRQIFDINVKISGKRVDVTLHGNGFMRYMIRYIIGTSLEVARGKLTIEDVDALLDASSIRNIVSWKAPASGLTLLEVVY